MRESRLELQVSEDFKSPHTINNLILIFFETFLNPSFFLIHFQNILIYMVTVTLKFQENLKGLESVSSLSWDITTNMQLRCFNDSDCLKPISALAK